MLIGSGPNEPLTLIVFTKYCKLRCYVQYGLVPWAETILNNVQKVSSEDHTLGKSSCFLACHVVLYVNYKPSFHKLF